MKSIKAAKGWDGAALFICPMCRTSPQHTFSRIQELGFQHFQMWKLGLCRYHYELVLQRAAMQFHDCSTYNLSKTIKAFESDICYARKL